MNNLNFDFTQVRDRSLRRLHHPRDSYDTELQRADAAGLRNVSQQGVTTVSHIRFPTSLQRQPAKDAYSTNKRTVYSINAKTFMCISSNLFKSMGDKLAVWVQEQNFMENRRKWGVKRIQFKVKKNEGK